MSACALSQPTLPSPQRRFYSKRGYPDHCTVGSKREVREAEVNAKYEVGIALRSCSSDTIGSFDFAALKNSRMLIMVIREARFPWHSSGGTWTGVHQFKLHPTNRSAPRRVKCAHSQSTVWPHIGWRTGATYAQLGSLLTKRVIVFMFLIQTVDVTTRLMIDGLWVHSDWYLLYIVWYIVCI